jgi:nuclear transport factor 2 (NTF2) superfamily protein
MVAFHDDLDTLKVNFFKKKEFNKALKQYEEDLNLNKTITFFKKQELIHNQREILWDRHCTDQKIKDLVGTPEKRISVQITFDNHTKTRVGTFDNNSNEDLHNRSISKFEFKTKLSDTHLNSPSMSNSEKSIMI